MTEPELLQLIKQAKQEGWTELDLNGQYLTSLPPALGELRQLTVLKLGWNQKTRRRNYLTALPEWLTQLTNLQSLSLSANKLTQLPEWLAQFTSLQSLHLSSNKLTELPDRLAQLTNLQSLDLSANKLTALPGGIGQLTKLQSLNLSFNKLTVLPECLAQLTNLQSLSLSANKLTALPEWLAQLTNLQSLSLSASKLTALPEWLAQLTNLQSLSLSVNNLTALPEWLAQFTNLQSLDLISNNLTALPEWLAQLTNLQSLYLNSTNLTALPEWLAQLTNLQLLDLSANNLTALPKGMTQLTNLQSLYLSANNLTALPECLMQLTNLQSLSLSANKLTVLPEWLAQFTNLQSLDLSNNNLTALPEWLAQLTNLQSLDLSYNKLTALPEGMAQLTKLQTLKVGGDFIRSTNLTVLPEWLSQLTNLQSLDLSSNKLTALPECLTQFTNLQTLSLSRNNLTALPEWLAQFTNLQSLDLRNNNLTALPEWLADPQRLSQLRTLQLAKNPLTEPPAEVLGEALTNEHTDADIEAIRSYFRQLQEKNVIYFYEAKLLIIGEGGAGKTSLANKLLDPACQLSRGEKSTEGIAILTWEFALPEEMADDNYQVNIWDFGGQEIYFATHQFFLTKRSVYLLVADTRRQHTDFYNWLRMQETFGGDSAVLLVKNRNRQLGNSFTIENLPQLRERFPNLKEIIELDLNEVPNNTGWTDLLHHLEEYLLRLDHIGQPRPATWVAVRQAIDIDQRDVITWKEFLALCQEKGMKREEDIQLLGEYLHNLGDILYFHEDAVLCDYVILKPTWGLDAVYKVLDNPQIIEQLGEFNRKNLRQLWSDSKYQGYQTQLLRLMENFQLCYPLAEVKDTYIAPQLLTEEPPNYEWDGSENLQLRYVYPVFMPRGILSRAIVKLHQRIEAQRLVWRSGVILNDGYARAEVLELRGDQQIRIRVSGRNKRDLLMEIVRALDELHQGFPKLQFERRIPCNCAACQRRAEPHFYALEKLRERLANRKEMIECQLPPYHEVTIREMLDEFGDLQRPGSRRGEIWERIDELQTRSIVFNKIDTGGGPYVGGDVDAGGDFVGRDKD